MKTAMIWGAGGGIGSAIITNLANEDWTTVAITHQSCPMMSADHTLEADVSRPFAVQQAVHAAAMEIDTVDLWVSTVSVTSHHLAFMA